ncbi:hypothetical protein Sjap_008297 [Stephania japonica]|uniref:Uncharacterized protein n=1 Tax=Stephania japonica TaxID=461633 RepID=A0AAP0JQT4_9MAGN
MQLRVEFGFGEERELEYSYSDEEEFVFEEEIDMVLFLYGDARRIDPIFFEEDFKNFDEEPKFDSDGYDFVEDKLVFGEDGLVIEVISLFEVSPELEEVVRDVDVNNDSLGLIAKKKYVETSCDDFIVKAEKTREETKGDSSSDRDNAYNDEDCQSEECIDLIECNDGHIFDINKPPFFDDNDDAIVEEKVVFGYDGRVLESFVKRTVIDCHSVPISTKCIEAPLIPCSIAVAVVVAVVVREHYYFELEYSYSDEEEFVSEEEIDVVLFIYGDARRIDPIFFEEDFENFDEEPKFDSDGYDIMEDKLVFGEDGLVIEVVTLFEVSQELEEVVRDVDVNNDSLDHIAKAKVLKFATNDGICVDGYLHDFSSQNNVLFYLFKHVETNSDDFIVKAEKMREETKGDSSSDRDNAYNDEDCRSEECIDLIECNDGHIFDINKPPFFDDNDDAILEEKVVFRYDGRVLEVTLLTSKSQVSVVVSCDEASSTKIRGCRDEVDNYLVEKLWRQKCSSR